MKIKEENFISQLKRRNEKALEYAIQKYGWIVKSIITSKLYHLQSYQEDCINDVFLGVWNNIDCFDEKRSTFQNWVAGIARYKSIDYLRKYLSQLKNENWDDTVVLQEDNSHIALLERELSEEMENMLSCLSTSDQTIFKMLYVEERDMEQVSDMTGIKKDILYNRVSRGKKRIRDLFPRQGKENKLHG